MIAQYIFPKRKKRGEGGGGLFLYSPVGALFLSIRDFTEFGLFGKTVRQIGLRTVPTNLKVFLRGLLNMREKQILTSVIEIQKENWG